MENKRIRVGGIAVLFTVVMVSAAVFAVLTLLTAGSDLRTANSYGQHVAVLYESENRGEDWLAAANAYLDGSTPLPENTRLEDGVLETEIAGDAMTLRIRMDAGTREILQWSCQAQWVPEEDVELWK